MPAAAARRGPPVQRALLHPLAKPLVLLLGLAPLAWLVYAAFANQLGANPAEALVRGSGDWTLRLLCLTLAVTPLRQWTGWHALLRFRRMLGLLTFTWGVLHFLATAWLDFGFDWPAIVADIAKRPFILAGSAALLLMLPLAATSFNAAIKAMGGKRWQALHRLVYASAALALLHFFWMRAGKNNFGEPLVYLAIVAVLLGWRLWRRLRPPGVHKAVAPRRTA